MELYMEVKCCKSKIGKILGLEGLKQNKKFSFCCDKDYRVLFFF